MSEIPEHWYPYKDKDGKAVTITWDHIYAIWHAFRIWQEVYKKEKGEYPDMKNAANWQKSCLLRRLLVDGKPPLPEPPPVYMGAPAYHLVDEELCPYCGELKLDPGGILMGSIVPPVEFDRLWTTGAGAHRWINGQWEKVDTPHGKTYTKVICNEDWHPRK